MAAAGVEETLKKPGFHYLLHMPKGIGPARVRRWRFCKELGDYVEETLMSASRKRLSSCSRFFIA